MSRSGLAGLRVDYRASLSLVGTVLKYLAVPLALPTLVAVVYGESVAPFLAAAAVAVAAGTGLERLDPDPELRLREGFLMVSTTWIGVGLVGVVPYLVEAHGIPGVVAPAAPESTLGRPTNALFESMSGFTTTGATVMGEISTEAHGRGVLLWRQLTQWLGGMGIVVLAVAVLPELSAGGAQLMDAEAPGPSVEKLTPRIAETARALWIAYVGLTLLEIALLYGLHLGEAAPNMTAYNAVAHGLTTMPTGGFSPEARSIEAFSAAVQWVIVPFMIAAGTNFALFWKALSGDPLSIPRDAEFRTYAGALGVLTAIVAGLLFGGGFVAVAPEGATFDAAYLDGVTAAVVGEIEPSLRHAAFQAVSITTTTGYASIDFNAWSGPAQYALLFAMFVGGSAGSTGGGIKIVRWYVIAKSIRRELLTTAHPETIKPVRLAGSPIDEDSIRQIHVFTLLYVAVFFVGTFVLFLDAVRVGVDLSILEAATAAAATVGNIGPGFGLVGPMGSYRAFSPVSKTLMVVFMWAGRLEILPLLVCLTPAYWRR